MLNGRLVERNQDAPRLGDNTILSIRDDVTFS